MNKTAFGAAVLLCTAAGCSTPKLDIREVGAAHVRQKGETASARAALGLSQLALGNVGLATESFRRALREEPGSHEAMLGLAECYLQMGKPSLARRSLEQALALRPDIPELYRALAAAAEGEGRSGEAAQLRNEADFRSSNAILPRGAVIAAGETAPASAPTPSTITVDLALEPLRQKGPRLVRLSMGEIVLVTSSSSPFGRMAGRPDPTLHRRLRILNAARVQGIAAGTRKILAAKGLAPAQIGDWVERKEQSELRFDVGDLDRARAIAASLPFEVRMVERAGPIVLLIGRNAAS